MKTLVFFLVTFLGLQAVAQVGINAGNLTPAPSSGLDINFSDKGVLIPRMTLNQRDAIAAPAEGLIVFCTNCGLNGMGRLSIFTNGNWMTLNSCNLPAPAEGTHTLGTGQLTWNWTAVTGATGYRWNTVNNFDNASDLGNVTSRTESVTQCNITYARYVWAYSGCGVSPPAMLQKLVPSSVCTFVCGNPLVDSRNGKSYNTVQVGSQCWMAQNLNVGTRMTPPNWIPVQNGAIEKYCLYNDESLCDIYGGLYAWNEAMNYAIYPYSPGICPAGWRLPVQNDWNNFGGNGGMMKETGTAHWQSPNTGATNWLGFTGLGGGYYYSGTFYEYMQTGRFWTSNESGSTYAWSSYLVYNSSVLNQTPYNKTAFLSVRCLKN